MERYVSPAYQMVKAIKRVTENAKIFLNWAVHGGGVRTCPPATDPVISLTAISKICHLVDPRATYVDFPFRVLAKRRVGCQGRPLANPGLYDATPLALCGESMMDGKLRNSTRAKSRTVIERWRPRSTVF